MDNDTNNIFEEYVRKEQLKFRHQVAEFLAYFWRLDCWIRKGQIDYQKQLGVGVEVSLTKDFSDIDLLQDVLEKEGQTLFFLTDSEVKRMSSSTGVFVVFKDKEIVCGGVLIYDRPTRPVAQLNEKQIEFLNNNKKLFDDMIEARSVAKLYEDDDFYSDGGFGIDSQDSYFWLFRNLYFPIVDDAIIALKKLGTEKKRCPYELRKRLNEIWKK
ncbi:MAG: hypothetical protein FWE22_07720 [Firmicutes bacterium]|nr:hypothetical protein [Bacillota bacterium]